jgi:ABC-type polysaccharide/polyol phosphate transport system ATPase subunit
VATGNLDFAKQCDTLIVLEKGKIKYAGKPMDVLKTAGKE